jgi:hypothetical protein
MLNFIILSIIIRNVIVNIAIRQKYFMFSVAEYHYAEDHYAVYCYAACIIMLSVFVSLDVKQFYEYGKLTQNI